MGYVVGRAFVVVAENHRKLLQSHWFVGLYRKWIVLVVGVELERRSHKVENSPFATAGGYAVAAFGCVGVAKLKVCFRLAPSRVERHLEDVFAGHEHIAVFQVYALDSAGVGIDGYVVVGNALCNPDSTFLALARTDDFKVPNFVLVGNGEAFSNIYPTIFLNQFTCKCYGFAGCSTTF